MPTFLGVRHVGIRAKDPQALAAFYRDVMGMTVTGGREPDPQTGQSSAFLSCQPDAENHDLAIFTAPLHHVAFKAASLAELQSCYREIKGGNIPIEMMRNHGCSLAFYFRDPENNLIEVYWPTGHHHWQPYGHAIDLERSESALVADVERLFA